LPAGANGIEFTTNVPTTPHSGTPYLALWFKGSWGVYTALDSNKVEYAWIPVVVTKRVPP
jgi:hypothetical protein